MSTIYILYYILAFSIIPMLIWGIYTQIKVDSTFKKFSEISNRNNYTADAVVKLMLERHNMKDTHIVATKGSLTDNYNPKTQTISLSQPVFGSTSISAIGVAAHECGHAIQHKENYIFIKIRAFLIPIVNFLSYMFFPLVIIGIIFSSLSYAYGIIFIYVAIAFYTASTIFYLITLPVEINASKRALKEVKDLNILNEEEITNAKQVLHAAAMTYIVAFITSLLYLLRFVLWAILAFGSNKN